MMNSDKRDIRKIEVAVDLANHQKTNIERRTTYHLLITRRNRQFIHSSLDFHGREDRAVEDTNGFLKAYRSFTLRMNLLVSNTFLSPVLSDQDFFGWTLFLPSSAVPCGMTFERLSCRVIWPNQQSFCLLSESRMCSCGPAVKLSIGSLTCSFVSGLCKKCHVSLEVFWLKYLHFYFSLCSKFITSNLQRGMDTTRTLYSLRL